MAISEFSVTSSNTNQWASVETSAVGGSTKYGIYVTDVTDPIHTFRNINFYPNSQNGTQLAIVELYANSEAYGTGDPNDTDEAYDGVAFVNTSLPSNEPLWENSAVYGINANTKLANYVYSFTNKGYADTKIMGIGGNKNRRVFAIRSLGALSVHKNQPYIAFIGDSGNLWYNGDDAGYSVACVGSTKTAVDNEWVSHTAGDGTRYYSITNTTTKANIVVGVPLSTYHTYRFTLHAHTEASFDGVAICKTTTDTAFSSLKASDLISGNATTGKCSGKDKTTTFNYTAAAGGPVYIYFKSDSSTTGPGDGKSFADVMVEDLGDLRDAQTAPTAANVTVEYEETATASASGGGGYGALQYRVMTNPSAGIWGSWTATAPSRTAIGTTKYQARYAGNASYKPSAVSNTATLAVIPRKITKPTAVTGLVYNGNSQFGVNPPRYATIPSSPSSMVVGVSGTTSEKNAGSYSATYKIKDTIKYCWVDMTTASITVNWSIAQREVTLSWGTTSWLYDGIAHSTTCTVGGLVGSDSCTVNLSNNSITDIGSIRVTATSLSNSNYKLPSSNTTATLTIRPCMYVKSSDGWVPVIQAYKKENGVWVRQTTTIGSLFSTSVKYLGRYQDPNTGEWKNLIDG